MDDPLLDAYELACMGDFDAARRQIQKFDNEVADDMRRLIESLEAGDAGEAVDALHLNPWGLHSPPVADPAKIGPDPVPFYCLQCGQDIHYHRPALLNTRWTTFFGFDDINGGASLSQCRSCGHIVWFLPAAPGALQALADGRQAAPPATTRTGFECRVCKFNQFWTRRGQLNTRGLTLFGLDFLNSAARCDVCVRCGHVHWHMGQADWAPRAPADRGSCLGCGGISFHDRRSLLNSRLLTALGLDWLDEGATVRCCQDCSALNWYQAP